MKLLFDENLSPRLPVRPKASPDADVWDYAVHNEFAIVTKDSDFRPLGSLLRGLCDALSRDAISPEQVKRSIASLRHCDDLVNVSPLLAKICDYEQRGALIKELLAAVAPYVPDPPDSG